MDRHPSLEDTSPTIVWNSNVRQASVPHVCDMNFIAPGVYDVDDVRRIWSVSVSRETIACKHVQSKS